MDLKKYGYILEKIKYDITFIDFFVFYQIFIFP